MDHIRPLLAMFCIWTIPAHYSQYISIENMASAFGFLLFAINELHKLTDAVLRKLRNRRVRRRKVARQTLLANLSTSTG